MTNLVNFQRLKQQVQDQSCVDFQFNLKVTAMGSSLFEVKAVMPLCKTTPLHGKLPHTHVTQVKVEDYILFHINIQKAYKKKTQSGPLQSLNIVL